VKGHPPLLGGSLARCL